jgi:hypothetical protein
MGKEWVSQPRHQGLYRSPCRTRWRWIRGREHVSGLHNACTEYLVEFWWGHALGSVPSRRSAQSHFIGPRPLAHVTCIANNNYHKAVKRSLSAGGAASGSPSVDGAASTSWSAHGTASSSLSTGSVASNSRSAGGAASTSWSAGGGPPSAGGPRRHRRSRLRNRSWEGKHRHSHWI